MRDKRMNQVLAEFTLTEDQEKAALTREQDIAVTAGAGSGKTSTLVARYVTLLADGIDLRRLIAVTFTDKAAKEMRSRIRNTLTILVGKAESEEDRLFWGELNARMDSARISTIHSLCAEILRAHPVEAQIDPKFEVLDEGETAILRAQTVEDTMTTLVGMPGFEPLFRLLNLRDIQKLLETLMKQRLAAVQVLSVESDPAEAVRRGLSTILDSPVFTDNLTRLRGFGLIDLLDDAGDKQADQIKSMLECWSEAETALANSDGLTCAQCLFDARRNKMALNIGKRTSSAKVILKNLREGYDELLNPICAGKYPKDEPPSDETEENFSTAMQLVHKAFEQMLGMYREALRSGLALDFDDLEQGAADLLEQPAIRETWQAQVDALLVDEFQDTNQRQRLIVEALSGSRGNLFVVGDAKQSIYRFRQADVTVFRSLRKEIQQRGGVSIELDTTFRSHAPLLGGMNDLLRDKMGEEEDPIRPWFEPFAALKAFHQEAAHGYKSPHIELVYGSGTKADEGRDSAARALVSRLLALKLEKQIQSWDEVALLFRTTNSFPHYEEAFEEAGIPFVTIAGKGFYDRAEIRDVLNLLRALDDPADNLAMAGLLRSPAFGLTDSALYQLRWQSGAICSYWTALHGELSMLGEGDRLKAERTVTILNKLVPHVDRIPVAELLKKLVDATDLRSILAIADQDGGSGRLWRNLDKLIEDAQESGMVTVREFLDNLKAIEDAGAREGEAPAEAQGSVRLMTIHKAKGLQYPLVVLADASRKTGGRTESVYLEPAMGLAFKMDPQPMFYRMLKLLDDRQSETEEERILYVALTRAQQKLIINGFAKPNAQEGWKAENWLADLGEYAGVDLGEVLDNPGQEQISFTSGNQPVRAWAIPQDLLLEPGKGNLESTRFVETDEAAIYADLQVPPTPTYPDEEDEHAHPWRVSGDPINIPPGAVGIMVHKALELWTFPGDPALAGLLETAAFKAGLSLESQRESAVRHAQELLTRLGVHPLRQEIEMADERHHELPYTRMAGDHPDIGCIDLIYETTSGWHIIDFKTDSIHSEEELEALVMKYKEQIQRYTRAAESLPGGIARGAICFMDALGKIKLVQVAGR